MNSAGTQAEPITKKKGVERLVSTMSELSKGNVFEGTVNSIKGKQVVLGLSNGQQITARLDGKISLQPGQSMFFQVKANEGNMVAIRPFTVDGNGANLTLLEALKAAGLPTGADHLAMVNKMMEEQMPIDRNSLNEMARLMQSNGQIDVNTLVQLKKLELPISIEFATQFENYQGDKQAINGALDEFMNTLPDVLSNENLSSETLTRMGSDILSIVTENLSEEIEIPAMPPGAYVELAADGEAMSGKASMILDADSEQMMQKVEGTQQELSVEKNPQTSQQLQMQDFNEAAKMQTMSLNLSRVGMENIEVSNKIINAEPQFVGSFMDEGAIVEGQENKLTKMSLEEYPTVANNSLGSILSEEQQQYLKGQMQVLFTEADQVYDSSKIHKDASVVSVLNDINELLAKNPQMDKKVLLEFFSGNEFKAMIRDSLEQQWTIRPKDLEGADKINRLYEKLENQLTRIEDVVKATGQQENHVTSIADNIRSNVDFMKQINEAYTYVQIPLKMSGQNASGQLYVYTNKKKLEQGEEDLTAFLHLDMDHLGPTDVSVRMHGKDVTTNFYLESDASFALLEQFMPQLEARLEAKGYNCKLIVNNESKKVNFVEDFLKKDQPSAGQVHRYSFDMRA